MSPGVAVIVLIAVTLGGLLAFRVFQEGIGHKLAEAGEQLVYGPVAGSPTLTAASTGGHGPHSRGDPSEKHGTGGQTLPLGSDDPPAELEPSSDRPTDLTGGNDPSGPPGGVGDPGGLLEKEAGGAPVGGSPSRQPLSVNGPQPTQGQGSDEPGPEDPALNPGDEGIGGGQNALTEGNRAPSGSSDANSGTNGGSTEPGGSHANTPGSGDPAAGPDDDRPKPPLDDRSGGGEGDLGPAGPEGSADPPTGPSAPVDSSGSENPNPAPSSQASASPDEAPDEQGSCQTGSWAQRLACAHRKRDRLNKETLRNDVASLKRAMGSEEQERRRGTPEEREAARERLDAELKQKAIDAKDFAKQGIDEWRSHPLDAVAGAGEGFGLASMADCSNMRAPVTCTVASVVGDIFNPAADGLGVVDELTQPEVSYAGVGLAGLGFLIPGFGRLSKVPTPTVPTVHPALPHGVRRPTAILKTTDPDGVARDLEQMFKERNIRDVTVTPVPEHWAVLVESSEPTVPQVAGMHAARYWPHRVQQSEVHMPEGQSAPPGDEAVRRQASPPQDPEAVPRARRSGPAAPEGGHAPPPRDPREDVQFLEVRGFQEALRRQQGGVRDVPSGSPVSPERFRGRDPDETIPQAQPPRRRSEELPFFRLAPEQQRALQQAAPGRSKP